VYIEQSGVLGNRIVHELFLGDSSHFEVEEKSYNTGKFLMNDESGKNNLLVGMTATILFVQRDGDHQIHRI